MDSEESEQYNIAPSRTHQNSIQKHNTAMGNYNTATDALSVFIKPAIKEQIKINPSTPEPKDSEV
jgi:hypothetical protein